jgi:tRNA(Ile2) C34 agmatinyltransferase TiaS
MFWLGIDDTDTLDSLGTNKLALHLVKVMADDVAISLVVRHQLFVDPRIPYTSHNGCVSLLAVPRSQWPVERLADRLRPLIQEWSPPGSDPGFCIADQVPLEIIEFGQRCQRDVVTQVEAHALARRCGIYLECVGGTGDGAIGALAGVGLLATGNDGRVLHCGEGTGELFDVRGSLPVREVLRRGVTRVEHQLTGEAIDHGLVVLSKRLRPNLRNGELVLYVTRADDTPPDEIVWQAAKVV